LEAGGELMMILDVLKEDHREVAELLKKISRVRTAKSREKYFVEMKQSLEIHAYLEQLIFYRALLQSSDHQGAVESADQDHRRITDQMAELDSLQKDDPEWMPKFRTLKGNIEDHVRKEETDLFERAQKSLSEEQLRKLGAEMVTKKAEQLAVQ
jgi:hemerythrin-like domain-containing protein